MSLERMVCCGALTHTYKDAGARVHKPGCPQAKTSASGNPQRDED